MTSTTVTRGLQAAPDRVFAAVAEPEGLPEVIPDAGGIEFLTTQHAGAATWCEQ